MQIFKWAILIVALLTAYGTLRAQAEENGTIGPFKIFTDGDALLIPVEFEGKTYQFELDTGLRNDNF